MISISHNAAKGSVLILLKIIVDSDYVIDLSDESMF